MFIIIDVGQKCSSGLFDQALHWFESAARRFLLEHSSVYQRSVSKAVSSIRLVSLSLRCLLVHRQFFGQFNEADQDVEERC